MILLMVDLRAVDILGVDVILDMNELTSISCFFETFFYFSNFTIFFQVEIDGGKLSRVRERTFASRGKA